MSFHVASTCMQRKFGSATRKQIISFLADKASDDGSGIWCSKGTIAQNTELSKSTVKRIILEFLNEGIISETGKRANSHGFTVEYRINLARVIRLESTARPPNTRGFTTNPVQDEPPREVAVHPQEGSSRTPNNSSTILEPPTRERVGEEDIISVEFDNAWNAYPDDRRRNEQVCREVFADAVCLGVAPEDITSAIQTYAKTTAGYTRDKVKFSDNWFRSAAWVGHIAQKTEAQEAAEIAFQKSLSRCEAWIKNRDPMCRHITKPQADALVEMGSVNSEMLALAGVEL